MNETTLDLQNQLDLLVDGELPENERQDLLTRLDESPDGWRQCALSFLEAQSVQRALKATPSTKAKPQKSRVYWPLAALAAVLLAFVGGYLLAGPGHPELDEAPELATNGAASEVGNTEFPPVPNFAIFESAEVDGMLVHRTHRTVPDFVLQALVDAGHRVQRVERLLTLESADGSELELPLRETRILEAASISL